MRFIGVDGPRWLLRGLIIGAAANGTEPAEPFEDILSDVVVVRGDGPMPPRDMLEIRLPAEIQQAIEQQQAAAAAQAAENETAGDEGEQPYQVDLNPFERGPEFTETR
jgi:ubiquitin